MTTPLAEKIEKLVTLIEHKNTGEGERNAAQRMLDRLRNKAASQGDDVSETSRTWSGYYRLPTVQYGSKYEGYLSSAEITKRIRADITFARKFGKQNAKAGSVKIADPIADAPDCIKFSVRKQDYSGGRSIDITIKGVPSDWWIDKEYPYHPGETFRAPGPRLQALRDALKDITWAYNYDGSDAMVDYFHRNFYDHYRADGHGQGTYPRDI